MVKIVAISDTHTRHKKLDIPQCDILIHCGDFSYSGDRQETEDFIRWMYLQDQAKYKVFISGNHDYLAQKNPTLFKGFLPRLSNFYYLQDSEVVLEGLKIYGTPWTPYFYDWAFNGLEKKPLVGYNYQGGPNYLVSPDKEHPLLSEVYGRIPDDVDILITHGPPNIDDIGTNLEGIRCGSIELLNRCSQLTNLKYGFSGHIHEGYGMAEIPILNGSAKWCNVSSSTREYKCTNPPVVIEV